MRISLDTNVLVYAESSGRTQDDFAKRTAIWDKIGEVIEAGGKFFAPAQSMIELHDVLVRKRGLTRKSAASEIQRWKDVLTVLPTTESVLDAACELSSRHNLRIFDAVIVASTAAADCNSLWSEDLQHGFVWRGVEIVNPFA